MADILIQIQPDATGWHSNLCYPSPYLRDGWAVVAPGDQEALRRKFVFLDLFYSHRGVFLLAFVLYAIGIQFLGFLIATILFLNIICNVMRM